jgi:uncharacterized OB-fold protein
MTAPTVDFPPFSDPALAPFWDGVRADKIVMQCCSDCGALRWAPAPRCPDCLSENFDWKEASQTGRLVSYATYRRAMNKATAGDVPYTVAYVALDDGPHIYGRLLPDAAGAKCDMRVRAVFHEIEPGLPFIGWELER